jgi:hypothetical protein
LIFLSRLQKEYDTMLKKPDQEYVKEGAESVTPEDIQTADERAEELSNSVPGDP